MSRHRLVLAVESTLVRAGLKCLIDGFGGLRVIAETGNGREAVSLARRLRPAFVVIAGDLPGVGTPEAARQIHRWSSRSRIVVLSGAERPENGMPALLGSAVQVLPRSASPGDLERSLRLPQHASPGPLTPRQRQVLKQLSVGSSVKEIARVLEISVKTVETHRAQLMRRLRIFDLAGLVRYALRKRITRL